MKGHGEKLSRKKEFAILALLQEPTLQQAAERCGLSAATLWRWLQNPEFQQACRSARREAFHTALARLSQLSNEAVLTLHRNLTCGMPATQIRAAVAILEFGLK